jgi:hypothetical protein
MREGGRHVQRVSKLGGHDAVEACGLIDGLITLAARPYPESCGA